MNGYKKIELYQEAVKFELLEDYKEAFGLYLASAGQGYARAQLAVAKYYLGDGVYKGVIKADTAKAIEYLKQAEGGGNAEAKYRLALILLKNNNKADTARALELLKDAADRQFYPASLEIAKCYYFGVGLKQSYVKTLEIFESITYFKNIRFKTEFYEGIRKILKELKQLVSAHKSATGLSEDDLCLLNDLCNDFCVDD